MSVTPCLTWERKETRECLTENRARVCNEFLDCVVKRTTHKTEKKKEKLMRTEEKEEKQEKGERKRKQYKGVTRP